MKYKFLPLLLLVTSATQTQVERNYKPDFEQVAYRSDVPLSVRRVTKRIGATRFFGSFQCGNKKFSAHFYDVSRILPTEGGWKRNSRLDVFQVTTNKTWQRIKTFPVTRRIEFRDDKLRIEAKTLWFDPIQKTTTMICLHVIEHPDRKERPTGPRTDIYGVLFDPPKPQSFIAFDGFEPFAMTTVSLSKISYPDLKEHLTILDVISNTGDATYTAYGWADKAWKVAGKTHFENTYETALVWNGSQFVSLAESNSKSP